MSRTGVELKAPWRALPAELRVQVEEILRAPVARAERVYGGYGPTPTYRLRLRDGRRAFFKGTGPQDNVFSREALVREQRIYQQSEHLLAPWAPACLGSIATDGWLALLLEDVGPKSVPPWKPSIARGVMLQFASFHLSSLGTELPGFLPGPPRFAGNMARAWQKLIANGEINSVAELSQGPRREALAWLQRHGETLSNAALRLSEAPAPYAFLHGDLRSDNLRWRGGRLRMFDWPHAGVGAPEFDAAATAQSITVDGGPAPETLLSWYAQALPLRPDVLTSAVAAVAGFFADAAWREELPGLPRLRSFQKAQLGVTLAWAAQRLTLPAPAWLDGI